MKFNYARGIFCLVIFLLYANQATAEDWEFRGFLPRGTAYYDKSGIKKINKNIYQVWTVTIYNENGKKDAFSLLKKHDQAPDNPDILTHESVLIEFDCENEKYRIMSLSIFDEIGSVLLSAPEINDKWRDIIPKSINDTLRKRICNSDKTSETDKK